MTGIWKLLLGLSVPVVWMFMSYIRAHVPHGEARFDSTNRKNSSDD